jgi:superfamily I DNA and/or RNA helicase
MLSDEGIPFLRLGNAASCDPQFHPYLIDTLVERMGTLDALKYYIQSIAVVVGTTSTLSAHQDIFSLKQFSLAIVDEASQILEPNIIGLLSSEQIERFILVGDYKQLPAVVQQTEQQARVDEPLLRAIGLEDCRQSLFERLIRWERRCQREQFIGILNHQGRMHPEVACFAQSHF